MGIDAQGLNCLRFAGQHGPFGRTVTLGRQNVNLPPSVLRGALGDKVDWENAAYCEPLLTAYFGATEVDSVDNSAYEQATRLHDMNLPLPPTAETYDTVIDFGTTEHVFHVAQALTNIVAFCRPGGQILHVVPGNNFCGHGFWQFSPELFFSLYSERNGFAETEIFVGSPSQPKVWYRVEAPRPGMRVPLEPRSHTYVICRTVRKAAVSVLDVQQSDYLTAWAGQSKWAGRSLADRFYRRVRYKYFRGLSRLNPHLTRVDVASFSA